MSPGLGLRLRNGCHSAEVLPHAFEPEIEIRLRKSIWRPAGPGACVPSPGEQAAPGLRPGPPRGSQGVCRVLVQPAACFYSETRYNSARRINLELHTQETPKCCNLARTRHGRARGKFYGFPMLKLRNVWRTCGSERPFEQLRLRKWRVPVPGLRLRK